MQNNKKTKSLRWELYMRVSKNEGPSPRSQMLRHPHKKGPSICTDSNIILMIISTPALYQTQNPSNEPEPPFKGPPIYRNSHIRSRSSPKQSTSVSTSISTSLSPFKRSPIYIRPLRPREFCWENLSAQRQEPSCSDPIGSHLGSL